MIILLICGQENSYSLLYLATEYALEKDKGKEGEKEEDKKEKGKKEDKNGV